MSNANLSLYFFILFLGPLNCWFLYDALRYKIYIIFLAIPPYFFAQVLTKTNCVDLLSIDSHRDSLMSISGLVDHLDSNLRKHAYRLLMEAARSQLLLTKCYMIQFMDSSVTQLVTVICLTCHT